LEVSIHQDPSHRALTILSIHSWNYTLAPIQPTTIILKDSGKEKKSTGIKRNRRGLKLQNPKLYNLKLQAFYPSKNWNPSLPNIYQL